MVKFLSVNVKPRPHPKATQSFYTPHNRMISLLVGEQETTVINLVDAEYTAWYTLDEAYKVSWTVAGQLEGPEALTVSLASQPLDSRESRERLTLTKNSVQPVKPEPAPLVRSYVPEWQPVPLPPLRFLLRGEYTDAVLHVEFLWVDGTLTLTDHRYGHPLTGRRYQLLEDGVAHLRWSRSEQVVAVHPTKGTVRSRFRPLGDDEGVRVRGNEYGLLIAERSSLMGGTMTPVSSAILTTQPLERVQVISWDRGEAMDFTVVDSLLIERDLVVTTRDDEALTTTVYDITLGQPVRRLITTGRLLAHDPVGGITYFYEAKETGGRVVARVPYQPEVVAVIMVKIPIVSLVNAVWAPQAYIKGATDQLLVGARPLLIIVRAPKNTEIEGEMFRELGDGRLLAVVPAQ